MAGEWVQNSYLKQIVEQRAMKKKAATAEASADLGHTSADTDADATGPPAAPPTTGKRERAQPRRQAAQIDDSSSD